MITFKKIFSAFLIFSYLIIAGCNGGSSDALMGLPEDTTSTNTVRSIADLNNLDVDYDLTTDKDVYSSGESIKITYTLTNNTGSRLVFNFNTVVGLNIKISSDGHAVFDNNDASVTLVVSPTIEIEAGSSQDFTFVWNQNTSSFAAVQAGTYTIEVFLTDQNDMTPERTKTITIN